MKILVVDDEEPIRRLVSTVLQKRGHAVRVASNALQALEALARDRIDLLISDCAMPGMTGLELAAAVRRLDPAVSILLMSGSEQPEGYPFLAKPFQVHSLLVAVQQAAGRPAATPTMGALAGAMRPPAVP